MSGPFTLFASAVFIASAFNGCATWMRENPAEVSALESEALEASEAIVKIVAPNLVP